MFPAGPGGRRGYRTGIWKGRPGGPVQRWPVRGPSGGVIPTTRGPCSHTSSGGRSKRCVCRTPVTCLGAIIDTGSQWRQSAEAEPLIRIRTLSLGWALPACSCGGCDVGIRNSTFRARTGNESDRSCASKLVGLPAQMRSGELLGKFASGVGPEEPVRGILPFGTSCVYRPRLGDNQSGYKRETRSRTPARRIW